MLSRVRLSAGAIDWSYQGSAIQSPHGELPEGSIVLSLKRRLHGPPHGDYKLSAYTQKQFFTSLLLHIDADFADIFEVKEGVFAQCLNVQRTGSESGLP